MRQGYDKKKPGNHVPTYQRAYINSIIMFVELYDKKEKYIIATNFKSAFRRRGKAVYSFIKKKKPWYQTEAILVIVSHNLYSSPNIIQTD